MVVLILHLNSWRARQNRQPLQGEDDDVLSASLCELSEYLYLGKHYISAC